MTADEQGMILVDAPVDGGAFDRSILERMGHPVNMCHGPGDTGVCPLLRGEHCEKFEHARGVVFELDLDRGQHRAIVARYRELAPPGTPIRIVVRPGQAERYADLVNDVEFWTHEPTVAELDGFAAEVEAVDRWS